MKDGALLMNSPGFNVNSNIETEDPDSESRSISILRGAESGALKAKKSAPLARGAKPMIAGGQRVQPGLSFKFGDLPKPSPADVKKRLSLLDIIPVVLSQAKSPPSSEE